MLTRLLIRNFQYFLFLSLFAAFTSCNLHPDKKSLTFKDYPNLRIGFSSQNFQKFMPNSVENLTEIIEYASVEGYNFIEIRDELAGLSTEECKILAEVAIKNKVDIIYEIHKNPLDSGYFSVFQKGLANTLLFKGPGILRTIVSKSEFDADANKKGWTKNELERLVNISDSCALISKGKNVQFIVENFNEAFFGDGSTFFGLSDFFDKTSNTGLQFDIGNPFRKISREKADPEKVEQFLSSLGKRWVTSHLKTVQNMGGDSQPVLTGNPLSVEKVISLMGKENVSYVAIELAPVENKEQCFNNHAASIQFLKERGILK